MSKTKSELLFPDVLSKLFRIDDVGEDEEDQIYCNPLPQSIVLENHRLFGEKMKKNLDESTLTFTKNNLQFSLKYRMIPLVDELFADKIKRMEFAQPLKIVDLRVNRVHFNRRLFLKIVSPAIWNRSAVHVVVEDENHHYLSFAIYNWSYVFSSRQIPTDVYIEKRLNQLLPVKSSVVLLDPWLKQCSDRQLVLRCESPNTHLILIEMENRYATSEETSLAQLCDWGNDCYVEKDNFSAIEFYTWAIGQLDDEEEESAINRPIYVCGTEHQLKRSRLLSNRCAAYLREGHGLFALADASIILAPNEICTILGKSKDGPMTLLLRCLVARLFSGFYDRIEHRLPDHRLWFDIVRKENDSFISHLEYQATRLNEEFHGARYDLQQMLDEQANNKTPATFSDLLHLHATRQRTDLYEIRFCSVDERMRKGYSRGSCGAYALQSLQAGTLILMEKSFATIDKRLLTNRIHHSINYWQRKDSTIDFCSDEILFLLNEVEKQIIISNVTQMSFALLKKLQPIRQWCVERSISISEINDAPSDMIETRKQSTTQSKFWRKPLNKYRSPTSSLSYFPWRLLFECQQENPFQSRDHLAWFPLASMFNHSCLPNCLWYFVGPYLFVYVCAPKISPGEELTISYCPLWIASEKDRADRLRPFGINSCQCSLCLYDRSFAERYENQLRIFANLRLLTRQKKLDDLQRFHYFQRLQNHYLTMCNEFAQRPVPFLHEFFQIESMLTLFKNSEKDSFLQRFALLCRFQVTELPRVSNPIFFFGPHLQLLFDYLRRCSVSDLKPWKPLLEYLYEIFTIRCHSSSNNTQKAFKEYQQFLTHLLQTQIFFQSL